jgi:hypothetical protein
MSNNIFYLIIILIPTFVIFGMIPRLLYVQPKENIYVMFQTGYDINGTIISGPYQYENEKNFFINVCNFLDNSSDIYYDEIFVWHMEYNTKKNEDETFDVYFAIIIKTLLLIIISFMLGLMFTYENRFFYFSTMIIGILLVISLGSNIIALHNQKTFNNLISNGEFEISGSIHDYNNETFKYVSNFSNSVEFLSGIHYDYNYYHFTKCEKITRMNSYNVTDISCFVIACICFIITVIRIMRFENNPERIPLMENI